MQIQHLPLLARLRQGQLPVGLPNATGSARGVNGQRGHSYRNAAFQALLNTPMFANFLWAHGRQNNLKSGCPIKPHCLACRMNDLRICYWPPSQEDGQEKGRIRQALNELWKSCLATFWGQGSTSGQKVGPLDADNEFYTESFLLQLLAEMQRQLEVSPG